MTFRMDPPFRLTTLAVCTLVLGACQSEKHTMIPPEPSQITVCSKCYDEVRKARGTGGPRGGLATNRMVTTHMCEECKTEMSIYSEEGVLMVKCAKCAPAGVPCDKCKPPAATGT